MSRNIRVFLSYGHDRNEPLVRMLKSWLQENGCEIWVDSSEIKTGDDWRRSITDGLLSSDRMVAILSLHSVRDPGVCLDEIRIALGQSGIGLVTVLVEEEDRVQIPASVSHIQWLDLQDWQERYDSQQPDWPTWLHERLLELHSALRGRGAAEFGGEVARLKRILNPARPDDRLAHMTREPLVGRHDVLEQIENWRAAGTRGRNLFWIVGSPGSGKSAIAAHLAHYGRDRVVAVQFCEWDKPAYSGTVAIVRTLAFQLAVRLPDYRRILLSLPQLEHLSGATPAELFEFLIAQPLRDAIDGGRERCLIVIDGVDECSVGQRNPLAELLARQAASLPDWIGIVLTSRPEKPIELPLRGVKPLDLDKLDSGEKDVAAYIRKRLEARFGEAFDESLAREISARADGSFLYAELACDQACEAGTAVAAADSLPEGLGGVYWQWLTRAFPDPDAFATEEARAFGVLLAAGASFPVDLLRELLDWSDDRLEAFVRSFGALFVKSREYEYRSFRPVHKSLADWLTDPEEAGPYFVSLRMGHAQLADFAWQRYEAGVTSGERYLNDNLARHIVGAEQWERALTLLTDARLNLIATWIDSGELEAGRAYLAGLHQFLNRSPEKRLLAAMVASQLARLETRAGNLDAAAQLLSTTVRDLGNDAPEKLRAICLHELASIELERGDRTKATSLYRRALRVARASASGAEGEVAANALALATIFQSSESRWRRARFLASLAVTVTTAIGDHAHRLDALRVLADIDKDRMRFDEAEETLSQAISEAQSRNLLYSELALLNARGWAEYQRLMLSELDPGPAAETFRLLAEKAEKAKHFRFVADAWTGLGQIALRTASQEDLAEALAALGRLLAAQSSPHIGIRYAMLEAGKLVLDGQYARAAGRYRDILDRARSAGLIPRQIDATVGLVICNTLADQAGAAQESGQRLESLIEHCCPARRALARLSLSRFSEGHNRLPM